MPITDLTAIFSIRGLFYGLILPILIVELLALVLIPSLLRTGAKPKATMEALYCYLMLGVGVLLMTIGALPTVYSVLAGITYTSETYIALLLVFASGGAVFLWHDNHVRTIDSASQAVPAALYFYLFKIIGRLLTLLAAISLSLNIILGETTLPGWWITPLVILLYGLLLSWCTREEERRPSIFRSTPVATKPAKRKAPLKRKRKK